MLYGLKSRWFQIWLILVLIHMISNIVMQHYFYKIDDLLGFPSDYIIYGWLAMLLIPVLLPAIFGNKYIALVSGIFEFLFNAIRITAIVLVLIQEIEIPQSIMTYLYFNLGLFACLGVITVGYIIHMGIVKPHSKAQAKQIQKSKSKIVNQNGKDAQKLITQKTKRPNQYKAPPVSLNQSTAALIMRQNQANKAKSNPVFNESSSIQSKSTTTTAPIVSPNARNSKHEKNENRSESLVTNELSQNTSKNDARTTGVHKSSYAYLSAERIKKVREKHLQSSHKNSTPPQNTIQYIPNYTETDNLDTVNQVFSMETKLTVLSLLSILEKQSLLSKNEIMDIKNKLKLAQEIALDNENPTKSSSNEFAYHQSYTTAPLEYHSDIVYVS